MPNWSVKVVEDTVTPKLAGFPGRIEKEVEMKLDVVGADMVDLARTLVRVRTGALRDSINHRTVGLELEFGSPLDYAAPQEFGTRFMIGQPFIRPAFDANQQRIFDAVRGGCLNALGV